MTARPARRLHDSLRALARNAAVLDQPRSALASHSEYAGYRRAVECDAPTPPVAPPPIVPHARHLDAPDATATEENRAAQPVPRRLLRTPLPLLGAALASTPNPDTPTRARSCRWRVEFL